MKKFLLFVGHDYYPSAGIGDYRGSFETLSKAAEAVPKVSDSSDPDWYQILEFTCDELKMVDEGRILVPVEDWGDF